MLLSFIVVLWTWTISRFIRSNVSVLYSLVLMRNAVDIQSVTKWKCATKSSKESHLFEIKCFVSLWNGKNRCRVRRFVNLVWIVGCVWHELPLELKLCGLPLDGSMLCFLLCFLTLLSLFDLENAILGTFYWFSK